MKAFHYEWTVKALVLALTAPDHFAKLGEWCAEEADYHASFLSDAELERAKQEALHRAREMLTDSAATVH